MPRNFAWVLVASIACASPRPAERTSTKVGSRLELSAPDLSGRDVNVGAEQGKVRVVDFWATWCEPCKEAMPQLDALAKDLGSRGLVVYGVSIDEDRSQVSKFLQQTPVSFPILWDKGAVRVQQFDVTYMPVTLIVDRAGVIRHVHQGWDSSRPKTERKEIEALLAE
jgi:cytochrome c biogenesis protein CcmG, thiol:disulfide interchange protein DsbE